MKKFLLFIYFTGILVYVGFSQSISILDTTGQVLANGSTYVTNGTPTDDEMVTYLWVKNNTTTPISVMVKKTEISLMTNSLNMFCWGLCFAPGVYVSPDPKTIDGNAINKLDFSGHYVPNNERGLSKIRYTFYITENVNDSAWVEVTYAAFPLGVGTAVSKTSMSNAYPNPAHNLVSFTVNGSGSGKSVLLVRNILGSVVAEKDVTGYDGKVSFETAILPDGIYFGTLNVNGEVIATKKIVVRH